MASLHKLLGILLNGRLVCSPFSLSLNHLYQYGLMDIHFILWITNQYSFNLLFSLFPWELFQLVSVSLTHCLFHLCVCVCVLSIPLLSASVKCSRIIFYISCPNLKVFYFSKEPWRMVLETKIWMLAVLIATGI